MTSKTWPCDQCYKSFSTKKGKERHARAVHVAETWDCDLCDGSFGSEYALQSHYDAKHPLICEFCDKSFNSEKALEQHELAKHGGYSYDCDKCDRNFASEHALQQHFDAKHGRGGRGHDHKPPHPDIEGYWIPREEFEGPKSFGRFKCQKCNKPWGSAHAYPDFEQGCQNCETKSFPCCLWVNTADRDRDDRSVASDDGPHDSGRCEACKAGVCTLSFKLQD